MKYLLDTNTCIRFLNGRSLALKERVLREPIEMIAVCSVVKAELFYGSAKSNNPEKSLAAQQAFLSRFVSLPFDDTAASVYGRIRANLTRLGTPIGPNDLLIAAIALANNLTLVTSNTTEFRRIENLKVENWEL